MELKDTIQEAEQLSKLNMELQEAEQLSKFMSIQVLTLRVTCSACVHIITVFVF